MTSIPRFGAVYISQSEFHKLEPLGLNKKVLGYPKTDMDALRNVCKQSSRETETHIGATTRDDGIILVTHSDGPATKEEPKGDIYDAGGQGQRQLTDYLNQRGAYYRVGNFKDLFTRTR